MIDKIWVQIHCYVYSVHVAKKWSWRGPGNEEYTQFCGDDFKYSVLHKQATHPEVQNISAGSSPHISVALY